MHDDNRLIWNYDDLVRFSRREDPEVRYWAADRLIRLHPQECCDVVAELLLDDHPATPTMVARHLGEYGNRKHFPILIKGFKLLRGLVPGHCIHSLVRLGHPGVLELAGSALDRGELDDMVLGLIAEAIGGLGSPEAELLLRRFYEERAELLAEPAALRGVLMVVPPEEIRTVIDRFLTALHWKGTVRAGEGFRTIMDSLRIDDASWCFRTGPSGALEFRKTIKAVDAGYDCDILAAMGESTINHIAGKFRSEDLTEIIRSLSQWTERAMAERSVGEADPLPRRIIAAVAALGDKRLLDLSHRFGQQYHRWLLGFHLSAAFAVARYRNMDLELANARGDLDRLLQLAEVETVFSHPDLSPAIAVVCNGDPEKTGIVQEWCLRMLQAQGPFFPKVVALATLGELRAVQHVPEILIWLSDENSYIYSAAERALSRLGDSIIGPVVTMIEAGIVEPGAAQSFLALLCDQGSRTAYDVVLDRLDWFVEEAGPGTTAEWVSLFGTEELIEVLRDWIDDDPVMVGQALLILGALHDVEIPEEEEILRAIEMENARLDREVGKTADDFPDQDDGDGYVM
jgi:HEAT repeat protein